MKVVIDPGHGGTDIGCYSQHNGLHEADACLDIGLRVRELLLPYVGVLMTRDSDQFVSLSQRCRVANDDPDVVLFLSIHLNHATNTEAHGWEVFSSIGKTKGDDLARCIANRHAEAFPHQKVRGPLKEASFYVLRHTRTSAALWEGGFLSHAEESDWICFSDTRQKMAQALALGVLDFCGIEISKPELTLEERVARIESHLKIT